MRSLLLILALTLCPSCGLTSKASATLDDYKAVAAKLNKYGEKLEAVPGQIAAAKEAVDKRITDAENAARAAGLKVDGTDAEYWKSVKDNPGKSWTAGLGTVAMAGFGIWQRNRAKKADDEKKAREEAERQAKSDALAAAVDTVEELSPEAAKEFKTKVAAHPLMHSKSRQAVAAVQGR